MKLSKPLLAGAVGLIGLVATGPLWASEADRLGDVLRINEVITVMRDEGLAFGTELDADMLAGQGNDILMSQVAHIYDSERMERAVRAALEQGLNEDDIARSIRFFDTPLGQRILTLETTARVAMSDPGVESVARDTYADLKLSGDARLGEIARFIDVNDLLERNVAGSLSSTFHFMRGLAEGGASNLSEADITSDVWSQEEETRKDTESWLFGFLLMAYRPLSDAELEAYIAFSETGAGQALNAALFDGFDGMYLDISHALGVVVAQAMKTSDL